MKPPEGKRSRVERRSESGQAVLLMVTLSMVVLLGFAGFATDVGTLFQQKRLCQTVADSAAIAAATQINYGTWLSAAQADATRNGMTNGVGGATVAIHNPPLNGPHATVSGYVEVIATQSSPTFFMKAFSIGSMPVSARAVATLGTGKGCLIALAPSGTGLSNSGTTNVSAPQCGISVDGNMAVNGNVSISANTIGVAGSYSDNGASGSVSPTPSTGVAAVSDPLAYLTPPTCAASGSYNSSTGAVTAGSFAGGLSISGNGTTTFAPGVYCFGSDLKIAGNGTLSGTGVTFYFYNTAAIKLTGGAALTFSAPTSGTYNGILIYQDPSDTSTESLGGNAGGTLEGIIYVPKGTVSLGGTSNGTFYVAVIANVITLSGTPTLQNYATMNGTSPITAAVLVE